MPVLQVHMLGGFGVTFDGRPLTFGRGSTTRSLQLFQLLMLHQKQGVAKEKLMEALYEWDTIGNKNNSLNTMIYRLRKQLAAAGLPEAEYIAVNGGICRWVSGLCVSVDAVEFEEAVSASRSASGEREKQKFLERAVSLYRGELLPQISNETWVAVESARLKRMYEEAVRELCQILGKQREYERMLAIYTEAASWYPFEEWQVCLVDCLMSMNRYEEAYQVYLDTVKLYSDELGIPPSEQMLERFRMMSGKIVYHETDFRGIRETLSEDKEARGAYYCSYPSFVDTFRLLRRIVERSGQNIFLVMCSLKYQGDVTGHDKSQLEEASNALLDGIGASLRRGDVYTRHSVSQFLILLVGARQEDCPMIFERISRNFERNCRKRHYQVDYALSGIIDIHPDNHLVSFKKSQYQWKKG